MTSWRQGLHDRSPFHGSGLHTRPGTKSWPWKSFRAVRTTPAFRRAKSSPAPSSSNATVMEPLGCSTSTRCERASVTSATPSATVPDASAALPTQMAPDTAWAAWQSAGVK